MTHLENVANYEITTDGIVLYIDGEVGQPDEMSFTHDNFSTFLEDKGIIGNLSVDTLDMDGDYVGADIYISYEDYLEDSLELEDVMNFVNSRNGLVYELIYKFIK